MRLAPRWPERRPAFRRLASVPGWPERRRTFRRLASAPRAHFELERGRLRLLPPRQVPARLLSEEQPATRSARARSARSSPVYKASPTAPAAITVAAAAQKKLSISFPLVCPQDQQKSASLGRSVNRGARGLGFRLRGGFRLRLRFGSGIDGCLSGARRISDGWGRGLLTRVSGRRRSRGIGGRGRRERRLSRRGCRFTVLH